MCVFFCNIRKGHGTDDGREYFKALALVFFLTQLKLFRIILNERLLGVIDDDAMTLNNETLRE